MVKEFALETTKLMHSLCPVDRAKKKKKRSARGSAGEREEDLVQWGAEGL